jgi:hypothetical protein
MAINEAPRVGSLPDGGWQVKRGFAKTPHEYFREWQPFFADLAWEMLGGLSI